jgi:hypothetical protein
MPIKPNTSAPRLSSTKIMSSTEKDAQIAEMQETIGTLRWTLSQQQQQVTAPLVKAAQESAQAQADKIQEYTTKYEGKLQIMEEKLAITEYKVRQLEEDKEALSIHLTFFSAGIEQSDQD